jgi:YHS domain-containing protein
MIKAWEVKMATTKNKKQIDPVCGMEVDPANAAAMTCYNGRTIFFCAEGCKTAFEQNPKAYPTAHRKGIWRRYLDRLGKSTDGKSMACH